MRRPVIGVTLGDGPEPGLHQLREDYLRSVQQAGGLPLVLADVPAGDVPALLDAVDGVLLTGGGDVDPALFGAEPHPRLGRVNRRRDEFEIALARETLRRGLPLLGICRGLQVLNVAMGGTLFQDIPSELGCATRHHPPGDRKRRCHGVRIEACSRLRAIVRRDEVRVNSTHHQAVDRVAGGLVVSARCPEDGVVEGVEGEGARFVVAVQWHPEAFWSEPDSFQALFDAQAEATRS